MTAAAAAQKAASSAGSDSDQAHGPGLRAGSGDHARHQRDTIAEQGAQAQQRPWWRRRVAIWSFVVAAVLLVALVVLLVLGLLGYLKVGSFSTRTKTPQASSDPDQQRPNPLSTIPLLSEPTFTYLPPVPVPAPAPASAPAPAPPPITVPPAAATPTPTNIGTLNIVSYAMNEHARASPCGPFLGLPVPIAQGRLSTCLVTLDLVHEAFLPML
jgi:hypothetical protein